MEIKKNVSLVINKISIPVDEFITIANLYKEYEKEDKILKDKYKIIEPEYKTTKTTLPYNKTDNCSKPYEPEIKTAQIYRKDGKVGLKSGEKVVFLSDKRSWADSLSGSSKYFSFRLNTDYNKNVGVLPLCEILNAKSSKQKIGGIDEFLFSNKSKDGNYFQFVCPVDKTNAPVYRTKRKYIDFGRNSWYEEKIYTADEVEELKRYDEKKYDE